MTTEHESEAQKRSQLLNWPEGTQLVMWSDGGPIRSGVWRGGRFVPDRKPAPWRITHRDGAWWIEKRHTDHYEPHCRLETGAEAIATFAARWR